jgi:hypothetical protein
MGAGLGRVIEIVRGAGSAFFFEELAQPVNKIRVAKKTKPAVEKPIIAFKIDFFSGKPVLGGVVESVDFILIISNARAKT